VLGYTQVALKAVDPDSVVSRHLRAIEQGGLRATALVARILAISRPGEQEWRPIEMHVVVDDALTLLRESIPPTIAFNTDVSRGCGVVLADASAIHQVTMNLCTNAYQAMWMSGGTLTVGLDGTHVAAEASTRLHLELGPYVRLSVHDTGAGIDTDTLSRIFDPYFTTKAAGEGTGLGLAIVASIVK
jgi:signal transduction histidine kinase